MPEAADHLPDIASPCIGVCTLDAEDVCVGCFRTREEIAAWLSYSPAQRRRVIEALPRRAQACFDD